MNTYKLNFFLSQGGKLLHKNTVIPPGPHIVAETQGGGPAPPPSLVSERALLSLPPSETATECQAQNV